MGSACMTARMTMQQQHYYRVLLSKIRAIELYILERLKVNAE